LYLQKVNSELEIERYAGHERKNYKEEKPCVGFVCKEVWVSEDVLPLHREQRWLNAMLGKKKE